MKIKRRRIEMKKYGVGENDFGRSMIEMLGVLAIVGVLSIGGITGFQKAMTKHKINKATEELSQFINELLRYSKDWRRISSENGGRRFTSELDFFVPKKWERKGSLIYDDLGNSFSVEVRQVSGAPRPMLNIIYWFGGRNDQIKINLCMAYFDMAKLYADRVWRVAIWRQASDNSTGSFIAYGNAYCQQNQKCIKSLTLAETIKRCGIFQGDDKENTFEIHFPL